VRLRPGGPDDREALSGFVADLSVRSAFYRFLSGVRRPSTLLLARMLRRDETHGSWLAMSGRQVVGHVMWSVDDGVVDLGVVVADLWQRHGVGRRLVDTALAEAAVAGGGALRVDVHGDNRVVISMLRRALPDARVTRDAELLSFESPLLAAVPAPHPQVLKVF
jgi:acetyltransferase